MTAEKGYKILVSIGVILSVYILVRVAIFHIQFIFLPTPQEFREGALLSTTHLILTGRNPHDLAYMPAFANTYGFFYNLVVSPFAMVFGNTFMVHRAVSAIFLLASGWLLFYMLRAYKQSVALSIIAVSLYYVGSVTQSYDIVSRPDSLGFFLFITALLVPYRDRFSRRSLVISSVLSLLAFLAKPYFILAALYVGIYMFFFHSKKVSVVFMIANGALCMMTLVALRIFFPAYMISVIFNHYSVDASVLNFRYLFHQINEYGARNLGLILSFIFIFMGQPKVLRWVSYFVVFLSLSIVLIVTKLGHNTGNNVTYFTHLLSPFLLLIVFGVWDQLKGRLKLVVTICVVANMLQWTWMLARSLPSLRFDQQGWQRIEQLTNTHKDVFNVPITVHLMLQGNRVFYDNGMTSYYTYGLPLNKQYSVIPNANAQYSKYVKDVTQRVENKKFDVVLTSPHFSFFYFTPTFLSTYYTKNETVRLPMLYQRFWDIDVWYPKH